jgi:hypothetical protein
VSVRVSCPYRLPSSSPERFPRAAVHGQSHHHQRMFNLPARSSRGSRFRGILGAVQIPLPRMIKIDASNVLPKRLGTYLLGIIPGLVFELSVAFGGPLLAHQMIDRVKQVYPFQRYALLLLFAASCLVVGQTFFLLAASSTRPRYQRRRTVRVR